MGPGWRGCLANNSAAATAPDQRVERVSKLLAMLASPLPIICSILWLPCAVSHFHANSPAVWLVGSHPGARSR